VLVSFPCSESFLVCALTDNLFMNAFNLHYSFTSVFADDDSQ